MNLPLGFLIAALGLAVIAVVAPFFFNGKSAQNGRNSTQNVGRTGNVGRTQSASRAVEEDDYAERKLLATRLGLVVALFFLGERINQMRKQAQALTPALPTDGAVHSPQSREKSIILEQIRIADTHRREVEVALSKPFSEETLEAVRWPFTAANLQLSFAQKRLNDWA